MSSEHVRTVLSSLETWILVEMGLSIFGSISVFTYNFPLFCFAFYAYNNRESVKPLKVFGIFLGLSVVVDITAMAVYATNLPYQSGIFKFAFSMALIGLLLKPIIALFLLSTLEGRGAVLPFRVGITFSSGSTGAHTAAGSDAAYQTISPYTPPAQADYTSDPSKPHDDANVNYQTL